MLKKDRDFNLSDSELVEWVTLIIGFNVQGDVTGEEVACCDVEMIIFCSLN